MKRYWIKIGLGALGIFVLGMLLVSAGREGVGKIKEAVARQSIRISPGVAPFAVNDVRLGSISAIEVSPEMADGHRSIDLTVQADSGADLSVLRNCMLVATDSEALHGEQGLTCSDTTSSSGLLELGVVNFNPGGEQFPIFVPATAIEGKNWFSHLGRRVEQSAAANASRAAMNFQANSAGAFLMIKDEKGRPVFQLNADSTGAFIQIRDSNGKEIVRMRADSSGVEGHADTN